MSTTNKKSDPLSLSKTAAKYYRKNFKDITVKIFFKQWLNLHTLGQFDYERILVYHGCLDQEILSMSLTEKRVMSMLYVNDISPEEVKDLSLEEKLAYIYLFVKE